jgi:quercetin dioxygenase-like cupin family protein
VRRRLWWTGPRQVENRGTTMKLLMATLLVVESIALAQDAVQVSPHYKAEIDNTWVRVLRVKEGPHEKSPMHAHPATVVVYLTDAHSRITGVDGKLQEATRKAGEVVYSDPVKHADENLSDKPLEAIVIELKPGAPKSPPITLDPVKLDPKYHSILLENDRVRAIRTVLEPQIKSPMHEHPHYVVVYLTELHTTMKLADGREVDNPRRAGEVAWRDALKHVTENIGDHTSVEIQVELK